MSVRTITRAELERWPRQRLRPPSRLKPDVWHVETPDGPLVVKDARRAPRLTRWLVRLLLARERAVLELLAGHDRFPQIAARVDRDSIALEFVDGRPLDQDLFLGRPRELVAQLSEAAEEMHARGVFHLDLHQRKNLLIAADGRLRVVDFGAAAAPGAVLSALLGPLLRYVDRQAGLKYMARFAPELLTEAEARTVLRQRRLRRLWVFTRSGHSERDSARRRLRETST